MAELPVNFRRFVVSVIQKCTKFANFASVYFPYFTTFRQLGSFTNFNMLFLAVVKDFAFFAKMKIQFKRRMVHWPRRNDKIPLVLLRMLLFVLKRQ